MGQPEELLLARLNSAQDRYNELGDMLAQPELATDHLRLQEIAQERASLEPLVKLSNQYNRVLKQRTDAQTLLHDEDDEEIRSLAREDLDQLDVLKIEAALFASELGRLYTRYAERNRWTPRVLSLSETGLGGIKELILEIRGQGAYSRLKFESGVHRVQRVPVTETGGRIHTSTATVAVLPEAEEVDIQIRPEELRVDTFRAGGHGGQNVQKLETAIRVVHIPTGLTVVCQDERSQIQNRLKAMTVLRTRLYDLQQREQAKNIAEQRRSQVGTGDRSEKVRTYNFPQNRVTDHRVGLTAHSLTEVMEGDIDGFVNALEAAEQARKLEEAIATNKG